MDLSFKPINNEKELKSAFLLLKFREFLSGQVLFRSGDVL